MAIALLASVPEVHLISGKAVCDEKGKVAFGSYDFELFLKLKEQSPQGGCEVLIYASHANQPISPPTVTWRAVYLDFDDAEKPALNTFRPPSTATDKRWGIFWDRDGITTPTKRRSHQNQFVTRLHEATQVFD